MCFFFSEILRDFEIMSLFQYNIVGHNFNTTISWGYHAVASGVLLMSSKLNLDQFQDNTKELHNILRVHEKGFHFSLVSFEERKIHLNRLVLIIVVSIFLWAS